MVNKYYDLATSFYEYGWGESFHFAHRYKWETLRESIVRHEHFLASKLNVKPGDKVLDVGCGGGILCESLARLGADVTGIDAAKGNIDIATAHAAKDPGMSRRVTYHATTAEEVAAAGAKFDAVVSLEVVEHVNDPEGFVRQLEALTDPGGAVFISTLNRTARSYALAILAAERVLGWVPPGTHEFEKFITPEELAAVAHRAGLEVREAAGMVYTPPLPAPGRNGAVAGRWSLSGDDLAVNYVVYMSKPK